MYGNEGLTDQHVFVQRVSNGQDNFLVVFIAVRVANRLFALLGYLLRIVYAAMPGTVPH